MDFLLNLDTKNGINRTILKGLVQLSREFGIHTLIEGVETEQQYGFVKEIGCIPRDGVDTASVGNVFL